MTAHIEKLFRNKSGFYTVEAALILPVLILAVLTIGYFIRIDMVWENAMHGALDECSYCAATAYGNIPARSIRRVKKRIGEENEELNGLRVYGTGEVIHFNSYMHIDLPAGFDRDAEIGGRIKYRGFKGKKYGDNGMGSEGLEADKPENPVTVFPKSGEKYHDEECTYVKAAVRSCILTNSVRNKYNECGLCNSGNIPAGSVVYVFDGEDTSYHRGSCQSIDRHTTVIDKSDAEKRGYEPCSKCGG